MGEAERPGDATRTDVEATDDIDGRQGGSHPAAEGDFQRQQLARHGRFDVGVRLGSGSYGAVFEAYDRRRNATVALKTLVRASAESLYRFKREFRSLSDLHHENLVALHELFADDDLWWFTMELVDGVPFDAWVSNRVGGTGTATPTPSTGERLGRAAATDHREARGEAPAPASLPFDDARLRDGLAQLVRGLSTLHASGRLHRDIKPSNVLVDGTGRVVILDFGLVTETTEHDAESTMEVAGTPAYMAPEQGMGDALDESCDWYALGVLMFRCLTGRLPFEGSPRQVLRDKLTQDPPDPRVVDPRLPEDLSTLCQRLMDRDPTVRPDGDELRRFFQVSTPAAASHTEHFVGRDRELSLLRDALDRVTGGQAAVAHISGPSGVGKSALARHFLTRARAGHPSLLVLAGRCFAEESVPYKALDSVVDALSRHLNTLPADRIARLLPDDAGPLLQVFPVLNRVLGRRSRRPEPIAGADPEAVRRRAFLALRELLGNVARRRPTVVFIDDLQWGDEDSVGPLRALLREPDSPPLLLLTTHRSEEERSSAILGQVLPNSPAGPLHPDTSELRVEPLAGLEAEQLARELLEEAGELDEARVQEIARGSGGSPFFLAQLATTSGNGDAPARTLEDVLATRLARLDPEDRALLRVLSVAGRPLPRDAAMDAAGVANGPLVVKRLRSQRLIRSASDQHTERLITYHDRIREVTEALLSTQERVAIHRSLAQVLEGSRHVEPDALAFHLFGCGEEERAVAYLRQAAEAALANLAFAKAAELFAEVLERGEWSRQERRSLRIQLARALSDSGRGELAAEQYMRASLGADALESQRLRTEAAGAWLRAGRVEEGLRCATSLFDDLGLWLPRDRARAIALLATLRARLAIRGLDTRLRSPTELDPVAHTRARACRSLASPLGLFADPIIAASVLAQGLSIALDSGDPYELARGFCAEANFVASSRGDEEAALDLLARARRAAQLVPDDPHLEFNIRAAEGVCQNFLGRPDRAAQLLLDAERWGRARVPWGVFLGQSVRHYGLFALNDAGRFGEVRKYGERWWSEARERGDRVGAALVQVAARTTPQLTADRVDAALERVEEVRRFWGEAPFPQLAWYLEVVPVHVELYRGEPALRRHELAWARLRPIGLHQWGFYRIDRLDLEARVCGQELRAHRRGARRRELRRRIASCVRALLRRREAPARARGLMHDAVLQAEEGRAEAALARLDQARALLEARGMQALAAVTDLRRATLIAGDTGERLRADATQRLITSGVEHPGRFADLVLPFPTR